MVIGGYNSGNPQAATDVLNVGSNTSCGVPSFPRAIGGHGSAVTPIGIVACGGENGCGTSDCGTSCYRLSTENKWVPFKSLKRTRAYFSMRYMDGFLWAIGGQHAKDSMEYIDLNNLDGSEWTVENTPFSLYGQCITEYPDNRFLLIGGTTTVSESNIDKIEYRIINICSVL